MIALMAICSKCPNRVIEWEPKDDEKSIWKKGWWCKLARPGGEVIGYETPELKFSYNMALPDSCVMLLEQTIANEEYEELFKLDL